MTSSHLGWVCKHCKRFEPSTTIMWDQLRVGDAPPVLVCDRTTCFHCRTENSEWLEAETGYQATPCPNSERKVR